MPHVKGVSKFTVKHVARRGPHKGWTIIYTYYKARIMVNGKAIFLGHFQSAEEAGAVYAAACNRLTREPGRAANSAFAVRPTSPAEAKEPTYGKKRT
jgi:hypothetical protein